MKISFFTGMMGPYVRNEIEEYRRSGHDVWYYSDGVSREEFGDNPVAVQLAAEGRLITTPGLEATRSERMRTLGTDIARAALRFPMASARLAGQHRARNLGGWGGVRTTANFVSRRGKLASDVWYVHSGPSGRRLAFLKSVGLVSGPIVVKFNGTDATYHRGARGRRRYEHMFSVVDRVGYGTEFMRNLLLEMGAGPQQLVFMPSTFRMDRLTYRPARLADDDEFRLVTTARLMPCKGIEIALQAVRRLRDDGINVRYDVLGQGPLLEDLRAMSRDLGLDDIVTFHGRVAYPKVVATLSDSDVFLLPGIIADDGTEENQCGSVTEAAAIGLPVVASRIGGIPEATDAENGGRFVPAGDLEAVVEALHEMHRRKDEWPAISAAGRAYVEGRFATAKNTPRYQQLFEELAAGS